MTYMYKKNNPLKQLLLDYNRFNNYTTVITTITKL